MFQSILTGDSITFMQIMTCLITAALCGLLCTLCYRRAAQVSTAFAITICLLPAIVMMVILMVNGNLGAGIAVAGSFSLVRFRSLPGRSSDIAVIFLAMGAGLACGMGYCAFALLMTAWISIAGLVLYRTNVFHAPARHRYLSITIPETLDYSHAFDDIFTSYAENVRMTGVKTVNLGALYQLNYELDLKREEMEKEMMDQIRTRNGNLMVRSAVTAEMPAVL